MALGRDLLINVTRFFRDSEVFAVLRDKILPAILKRASARKALRIWVPGCATGEEAYSIAMLVQELLTARGQKWDVKIFATDVIVLTASNRDRDIAECRRLGAVSYIVKPPGFQNFSEVTSRLSLAWTLVSRRRTHPEQLN